MSETPEQARLLGSDAKDIAALREEIRELQKRVEKQGAQIDRLSKEQGRDRSGD
jgi:hypothetical protein